MKNSVELMKKIVITPFQADTTGIKFADLRRSSPKFNIDAACIGF